MGIVVNQEEKFKVDNSVLNSISKVDIKKLEGIQKRTAKMVIELRAIEYKEKLEVLGLTILETRRKRGTISKYLKYSRVYTGYIAKVVQMGSITVTKQPGKDSYH